MISDPCIAVVTLVRARTRASAANARVAAVTDDQTLHPNVVPNRSDARSVVVCGFSPLERLLVTHPPIEERIDRLYAPHEGR